MSKRQQKKKAEAERRAKNLQCHLCTRWRILTDEHFPPRSAGNDHAVWAHTIRGMTLGSKFDKVAPPMKYGEGLKRRSLCQPCNQQTKEWYNAPFKEWTDQARLAMPSDADAEYIDVVFKQIEPLSILKQIITGALAASEYGISIDAALMRRMVLNPVQKGLASSIKVFAYLNPPRDGEADDYSLTTKRVCDNVVMMDVTTGSKTYTFAEFAHSPLGYVVLITDRQFTVSTEAAKLTELSNFAAYNWRQKVNLPLRMAVRNPFGSVPQHYAIIKGTGVWYKNEEDAKAGKALPNPYRRQRNDMNIKG